MTIPKRPHIHFVADMTSEAYALSPHFGVSCLSAFLKANLEGVRVTLSCMSDDVEADIERLRPDIIGFSCTSRYFPEFERLAGAVRKRSGLPILFGGVHISIAPGELPVSADIGVIGEGEETLLELLRGYSDGGFSGLESVKGIVYRKNGSLTVNPRRGRVEPLDRLPFRDLGLRAVSWDAGHRAVMITSRGCPFKCVFCASSAFWGETRSHSPGYVIGEMKRLAGTFGVKEILIYDDLFSADKRRVREIAELKAADPEISGIRLECLSRTDNFDDETAALFRSMGIYRVSFGMESGCPRTLRYLKGGKVSLEQIAAAVATARKYGLQCVGSFIIGSPDESEEEILETFRFIEMMRLDSVQITIATPFPGTALWSAGMASGKIAGDKWSEDYYALFAVGPGTDMRALLAGKRLLTGIDRERFLDLAQEAARIQNAVNFGRAALLRERLRGLMIAAGLGPVLRWRKRLLAWRAE